MAVKTEENLRNLKIDVKKIAEWESEVYDINCRFKNYSIDELIKVTKLIFQLAIELRRKYFIDDLREFDDLGHDKEKLMLWSQKISVDNFFSQMRYFAPTFINRGGHLEIFDAIKKKIIEEESFLKDALKKGITNNSFLELVTSKVHSDRYKYSKERLYELKLLLENHEIKEAILLIDKIRYDISHYGDRLLKLNKLLEKANLKKDALERFEQKHGKSFAKAAALDSQTRVRATSLKRLVVKTANCPYCDGKIGTDPHLDHIYPVSKGGLSIMENLIWCCSSCNSSKSDMGLIQFLNIRKLPIELTLARLGKMGKHI